MTKTELVRRAMAEANVQALLVTDLNNIGWLTGFTGTYGAVILDPTHSVFITDSRYTLQAQEEVRDFEVLTFASPVNSQDFIAQKVRSLGITTLGFEADNVLYKSYQAFEEAFASIVLVPTSGLFAPLRMVKSAEEIEITRRACALTDATFQHVQRMIQPGTTEYDINLEIEFYIRRHNADLAFPPIVVSGERSARPHGKPSEKRLNSGDFVTMDFGAKVDGYCADLTRTVVVSEASDRHREVYEAVLAAQLAAIAAIRPGAKAADVDKIARDSLATKDLARYFGHGLGHGLGPVVHDFGRMASTSTDVFAPGQIWTVEPGVYIPDFGGVRIEDDVLVTEDGVEVLTHSPKELLILP